MGLLGWALGGLALLAAGGILYYVIDKYVENEDIKECAKQAIKWVAGAVVRVVVTLISGNKVSFNVLDDAGTKQSVELEGTGVASNIYEGETLYI